MYKVIKKMYLSIVYCIVFIGLCINLPARISYEGVSNFDWWSNDIMISDLMYFENFNSDDLFLHEITPNEIAPEDPLQAEGVQPQMFKQGDFFEENLYKQYTSNIVIQRFFYRALDKLFRNSHETLLKLLYFINCGLAALVITGIFYWISDFASPVMIIICAFVLSFSCPYFTMYGKNLYWCMYSLFFPTFIMCLVVRKGNLLEYGNKKRNGILFLAALMSCSLKMLMYFEFVSTVMISMTIPIFYYCWLKGYKLLQTIKVIIWPFIGSIISFAIVFGIKIAMLVQQFGVEVAIYLINDNLGKRLIGNIDAGMKSYGPVKVTLLMLEKEFSSVKHLYKVSFFTMVMIAIVLFVYVIFNKGNKKLSNEYCALVYTTLLSVLAPVSWFVLAAPHTTIHNQFATINFFIPFGILIIILIEETIYNIWSKIKQY